MQILTQPNLNIEKLNKNTKAGEYSSQYLKKLIEKKNVNFTCWKQGDYDRYICSVSYKGNDIGIHMIENDHSKYITYFGKHPYMHTAYKRAQ